MSDPVSKAMDGEEEVRSALEKGATMAQELSQGEAFFERRGSEKLHAEVDALIKALAWGLEKRPEEWETLLRELRDWLFERLERI